MNFENNLAYFNDFYHECMILPSKSLLVTKKNFILAHDYNDVLIQ